MLSAKSIIVAAAAESDHYLCLEIDNTPKVIEIEDEEMTLFVRFPSNQLSLWKMMCKQADEHFTFDVERAPTGVGEDCIERDYHSQNWGAILSNDCLEEAIAMQITIPVSERALNVFLKWTATPAGCCKFFLEALHLSLGERSQNAHYIPGGLLGDYSHM